jgi:hypothetical protein
MEQIECSETSAIINQTPGKSPKRRHTIMLGCFLSLRIQITCGYSLSTVLVQDKTLALEETGDGKTELCSTLNLTTGKCLDCRMIEEKCFTRGGAGFYVVQSVGQWNRDTKTFLL